MPRTPVAPFLWWLAGPLLLALACSHDAPRDNPLDPTLTPPVQLQVALDDTAGTATLTWTRYEGEQPFAAYWVLRNIDKSTDVDTLERIPYQTATAYTDTSLAPSTAYVYRVSVTNPEGFEQPSDEERIEGYVTEAVRLRQPEPDPETGAIDLTWTQYRDPGFELYRVHRRDMDANYDSMLATIIDVDDTTFADASALHEVGYLYSVAVIAAGQELLSNSMNDQLRLPGVTITDEVFTSQTASCSLAWTQYAGPRFAAYAVQRRTPGLEWQEVQRIANATETGFEDTGLLGNSDYSYRVAVLTARGEAVPSDEVGGDIHGFVESWPLDVDDDAYVRLYNEGEDVLTVLVATHTSVRLLFVDGHGEVRGEQTLVDLPHADIEPRSVTTAMMPGPQRTLSLRTGNGATVLVFDLAGEPITREYPLFAEWFADPLGELAVTVGTIQVASWRAGQYSGQAVPVSYNNIRIWVDGQNVFDEGFDAGAAEKWTRQGLAVEDGWGHGGHGDYSLAMFDGVWRSVRLGVDLLLRGGIGRVTLGSTVAGGQRLKPSSHYQVSLSAESTASIYSLQVPAEGRTAAIRETQPLDFRMARGLPYRLVLELDAGWFTAWIATHQVWGSSLDDDSGWCNIVAMEGVLGIVAGKALHSIDASGTDQQQHDLSFAASETRSWDIEVSTGAATWLGYCLPAGNQVVYGRSGASAKGTVAWVADVFGRTLGGLAGGESGEFFYPISFDVGSDGRVFVLDAGNGRIQVFANDGEYLTQWGSEGSGEGKFDFGSGAWAGSFSGSICVDDEGFIYVADVGNKRIQKFSP